MLLSTVQAQKRTWQTSLESFAIHTQKYSSVSKGVVGHLKGALFPRRGALLLRHAVHIYPHSGEPLENLWERWVEIKELLTASSRESIS